MCEKPNEPEQPNVEPEEKKGGDAVSMKRNLFFDEIDLKEKREELLKKLDQHKEYLDALQDEIDGLDYKLGRLQEEIDKY